MDRILGSNQPLSDQHFQYFLYQVRVCVCLVGRLVGVVGVFDRSVGWLLVG